MRRHNISVWLILGYMIFFTSETTAANEGFVTSSDETAGFVIKVRNNPVYVRSDENGAFSVDFSLQGTVIDTTLLENPVAGAQVTIPYFGLDLTGTTDETGYFMTQKVPFTGKVVTSGNAPIANAWVSFQAKPLLIADTSDGTGAFDGGSVGVRTPALRRWNGQGAFLKGNRLMIGASGTQPIAIALFTMKGEQVFSATVANLARQAQTVALPALSAGSYILRVTGNSFVSTFRQVLFSSPTLAVQQYSISGGSPQTTAGVTSGIAVTDSLVAFADGYFVNYLALPENVFSDLKIVLTESRQWRPAGRSNLEFQGGMVKIIARECGFSMGQPVLLSEKADEASWEIEVPAHPVTFTYDFWMDTVEVTQKQYHDVMTAGDPNYTSSGWEETYGVGDDIPAYILSFGDAILYCNALSKSGALDTVYSYSEITGKPGQLCELKELVGDYSKKGYRLPTEAEWEYACRGGTVTDFYWNKNYTPYPATADDTTEFGEYCVWGITSDIVSTAPDYALKAGVASRKPNQYGLYDMAGSLVEWTQAAERLYSGVAVIDPKPAADARDALFMRRGGNWGNVAANIRSACRTSAYSNYEYWHIGFRTVKEVQ